MVVVGCAEAIIAIFLPPLAVALRTGCGGSLLLNILLTILGWIPGVIHAWIVILARPGLREQRKRDRTRRSSYIVEERYDRPHHHHHSGAAPRSHSRARSRSARPHERVVYREPAPVVARSRSRGRYADPYYGETGYIERRRKY